MDKRYQVFISSTFTDLKEERKAIIESLLNAKYIPAGMEMFSASNDEQFKYIKKIIDTCDYYILIVGARYGTINPTTGISFTEQEYNYAVSKNIPVLAFLHDDPNNLSVEKRDDDKKEVLETFRAKVSNNRLCRMWNNINDLVTSVIISLTEETSENPQLGWTRGSSYDTTELLSQINELRLKNEKLEKKILQLRATNEANSNKVENLACGNDTYIIKGQVFKPSTSAYSRSTYVSYEAELTWDNIFSCVGPYLVSFKNYTTFGKNLKTGINSAYNKNFSSLNDDCVQTIKVQLNALGLIDVTEAKATGGGIIEFIGLMQKGKDYLLYIKSIKNKVE
ncbi:DUF4062 domain-containing protein [Crassaminicella profunda]|uniref:DUF4062 domain-containing protein n=1 Tax=Crassaminicella profunda TaxID=1286698 RepID=UPI001CA7865E|nr:DUF4062 domain-containing protein [Crassaminicella profunda]QZY57062.1 DUF4062 domain-containing protein [Crassaminicella profunda]